MSYENNFLSFNITIACTDDVNFSADNQWRYCAFLIIYPLKNELQ